MRAQLWVGGSGANVDKNTAHTGAHDTITRRCCTGLARSLTQGIPRLEMRPRTIPALRILTTANASSRDDYHRLYPDLLVLCIFHRTYQHTHHLPCRLR